MPTNFPTISKWFDLALAAQVPEPNAMTLTTTQDGKPRARIVLLRASMNGAFLHQL